MKLAPLLLAITITAAAQTPQFTDPANLRGERVQPRDGRELPVDQAARGLEQLLRKLNTRASVMNIVAHPDDEDGGMLTLYSRGLGARVADLSLNRGEGGQNAMTGDFEDALGLLRTQELLASDRYTGVDQFFGTEVDFGFSKTKEEAFAKWGHDRVLYDVVRAIRLYRPLVLTSTWIGGVTDGHGQHQAAGQIAQEAFIAAGDPKVFPELTAEGILPWQPLRIYARVPMQAITDKGLFDYATGQYTPARFTNYITGEVTTAVPSADVIVHEGTPDPLLAAAAGEPAKTYVQFARLGLAQQKSQVGPGDRRAPAGAYDVAYHLYGSRLPANNHPESSDNRVPQGFSLGSHSPRKDVGFSPEGMPFADADPNFFTGIDTSIEGIATLAPNAPPFLSYQLGLLAKKIQSATSNFDPQDISKSAPALSDAGQTCDALIGLMASIVMDNIEKMSVLHELRIKRVQLNEALTQALGLHLDATSLSEKIFAHLPVPVEAVITTSHQNSCLLKKTWIENARGVTSSAQEMHGQDNSLITSKPMTVQMFTGNQKNPFETEFSSTITRPYFSRSNIEQAVYTLNDSSLRNAAQSPPAFTAHALISCGAVEVQMSQIVSVDGSDKQPLNVVPNLDLSLSTTAQILPKGIRDLTIAVTDRSFGSRAYPTGLCTPAGCTSKSNPGKDVDTTIYKIELPQSLLHSEFKVIAQGFSADQLPDGIVHNPEGYRPVGYGDLPRTNYFTPATTRIVPVDLKLPARHNIAYLPGTGDAVPEALASIGLTPTILTIADLTADKLKPYDTVILGVRTYAAHPELHGAPTQALLDYARNGGNVVIQYQTTEFTAADAPYPLALGSNEKVVDETAPVQLLGICDNGTPAHWCEQNQLGQTGSLSGSISDYKLLATPNKLTPADFNNWVEERGHGFLSTWDAHYTALTETHDPGQLPQRGGLITTQLGKGRWNYVAFALYRQLPEAVPGAFRLFVNLINP